MEEGKALIGALFYFNDTSTMLYQINGDAQPCATQSHSWMVVGPSHWGICSSSARAFQPWVEREEMGSTKPARGVSIVILMPVFCRLGSMEKGEWAWFGSKKVLVGQR